MTEDNVSTDADLVNNPFAYPHLIFTRKTKDYSHIPDFPGIYFLTDPGRIYIGRGGSLKTRIPGSVYERECYGQHFSRFHFIPMPIFRSFDLHKIETQLDLSRFSAAPSARLSHFPFEGDRAFPAQC